MVVNDHGFDVDGDDVVVVMASWTNERDCNGVCMVRETVRERPVIREEINKELGWMFVWLSLQQRQTLEQGL